MITSKVTDISSFYVVGINYKKSDASIRGKFSISQLQYQQLLTAAKLNGINSLFVLSTCNRTEIYAFGQSPAQLADLICTFSGGERTIFDQISYNKKDLAALEHLFSVAAGLDSQILGDYEIIGQIKTAVRFSKEKSTVGPFLQRIINEVLAASKNIRTKTLLSSGTVSVSYAAVQYLKSNLTSLTGKEILLVGTGKIGGNTCRNIQDYLPGNKITLINRSISKAEEMAALYNVEFGDMDKLNDFVQQSDVVIVATNALEPIINQTMINGNARKLLIDLSVPCNIDEDVKQHPLIELVNVDDLSKINDATLRTRKNEIPKVIAIINEHISFFMEWQKMRKHVPVLKTVKNHILKIQSCDETSSFIIPKIEEEKIQKVINGMAVKMRTDDQRGCLYIEAMNDYISIASN